MLLIVALIVLVNVPVARYGVNLAHLAPEAAALVIRDGLIVKGSGPEIYRLEGEAKRWIRDIRTFEAEGHVWEDVQMVSCAESDAIPDGLPIPEDAGSPAC